jgi:hypothetical protein
MTDTTTPLPPAVDRETWTAQVNELLRGGDQMRLDGRPTAQWSRIKAGRNDDLGTAPVEHSEQRRH